MRIPVQCKALWQRATPRQRQWLTAALVASGGFGVFWALMALASGPATKPVAAHSQRDKVVVNVDNANAVNPMAVSPVDQWLGTAGKELAQHRADREAQEKVNAERKAAEAALMQRLAELEKGGAEQRAPEVAPAPPASAVPPALPPAPVPPIKGPAASVPLAYPPPVAGLGPVAGMAPPAVGAPAPADDVPAMVRVSMGPGEDAPVAGAPTTAPGAAAAPPTLDNYLPVGILKGRLLSGLAAPTGGQAQGNPLPVLIRLEDDAVLPNRFKAQVKECFVIASAYGDISAERAYMRTGTLSCVRTDRTVLELPIEGNVFGEDGGVGVRGRLVTKQGQLLANALRAGIVGGIGQGFASGGTTFTVSPLGTLATSPDGLSEQMRRGVAGGVGRALDNLANYYIKLAEQTFPVIEVDASRLVDVVLTKGVRLPVPAQGVLSQSDRGATAGREDRDE